MAYKNINIFGVIITIIVLIPTVIIGAAIIGAVVDGMYPNVIYVIFEIYMLFILLYMYMMGSDF